MGTSLSWRANNKHTALKTGAEESALPSTTAEPLPGSLDKHRLSEEKSPGFTEGPDRKNPALETAANVRFFSAQQEAGFHDGEDMAVLGRSKGHCILRLHHLQLSIRGNCLPRYAS